MNEKKLLVMKLIPDQKSDFHETNKTFLFFESFYSFLILFLFFSR